MSETLAPNVIRLNYRDYCALPEDGRRYEILDGDLFMSPAPGVNHQRILMRLARILADHVDAAGLGEVFIAPLDILLGEHDIVQPDIVFVATANQVVVTEKHIRGVPDLLVEITSPSRPELDTRDKRVVYARCGVPCYWIVDPSERRVSELKLAGGGYVAASEPAGDTIFRPALFPGLAVDLSRLWVQ